MICVGILFAYCFAQAPSAVDSYCQAYQQVIVQKGDGSIQASVGVKRRLATNEVTYRCLCENWNNPICKRK